MPGDTFHLAQVNIAIPRGQPEEQVMAEFMALLDPVNALADVSEGFVWRLQSDEGNATAYRVFDDPDLMVNMSVWESLEALRDYVYRSPHAHVLRRRQEWFVKMVETHVALWWIEPGTIPTLHDAEERLLTLRAGGPTPRAFTLKQPSPIRPPAPGP